jgi:hypothetical protein
MKALLKHLGLLTLLLLTFAAPAYSQQDEEEEMSRYFREKDWVTWQQGIANPLAAKKLFIRDKEPIDYEALAESSPTSSNSLSMNRRSKTFLGSPNIPKLKVLGVSRKQPQVLGGHPSAEGATGICLQPQLRARPEAT